MYSRPEQGVNRMLNILVVLSMILSSSAEDIIRRESISNGIPLRLAIAVAMTESNMRHYDRDGNIIVSGTGDYGMFQVNRREWEKRWEWDYILTEEGNIVAGVWILSWCYRYSLKKGYSGDDLIRATYSTYNAFQHDRWKNRDDPRDIRFWDIYMNLPQEIK